AAGRRKRERGQVGVRLTRGVPPRWAIGVGIGSRVVRVRYVGAGFVPARVLHRQYLPRVVVGVDGRGIGGPADEHLNFFGSVAARKAGIIGVVRVVVTDHA